MTTLNQQQTKAFELMVSGQNIFLTGNAGTGKSFLVKAFIAYCEHKNKNVMLTAPTGIAALNINGSTIHRAFKVPLDPIGPRTRISKITEAVKDADIIIIDEISMVRFDVFSYIAKAITKATSLTHKAKQLIVVGDFFQLPPVLTDYHRTVLEQLWQQDINEGFAFEAPEWGKMNFKNIVLTEVVRQNEPAFIKSLNNIRGGYQSALTELRKLSSSSPLKDAIYICSTNSEATDINNSSLAKLATEERCFESEIIGNVSANDKVVDDELYLKIGARVMTLVNNQEGYYKNGSMGYITDFTDDGVVVQIDNGIKILIQRYTWEIIEYDVKDGKLIKNIIGSYTQIPLKLAYAITIHKSQGKTFESVNLNPYCFCEGQLYVALSRVTSCKKLYIKNRYINPKWLMTSAKVIDFYNSIAIQGGKS